MRKHLWLVGAPAGVVIYPFARSKGLSHGTTHLVVWLAMTALTSGSRDKSHPFGALTPSDVSPFVTLAATLLLMAVFFAVYALARFRSGNTEASEAGASKTGG